ncbi:unnamed protein product [Paramecium sonneborni]|uniref:DNA/RNA-binding protein Alba-like domain-containing protein n=1 Tax=Paramecium sonneborni TaxID=65129 RepID=A0A8S1M4J6_9CILI|nr:unnamed protein product [Paramecium sonneborni]
MLKERFDIMVKGKSTQDQIASYLVQVVLGLRDKENTQQSIRLLGCGQAIHHTILVAEIIRSRIQGLYSISEIESKQSQINNNNDQQQQDQFFNPAIRITLTMNPTEDEKLMPGFQEPNEVKDDKNIELFDYVMMYIRNLYHWRRGVQVDNRDNRYNRYNRDNRDNRDSRNNRDNRDNRDNKNQRFNNRDIKSSGDYNKEKIQTFNNNQESHDNIDKSDNWNKNREQFQQTQSQGVLKVRGRMRDNNRNDRNYIPQRRNYEQKNQDQEFQKRDENQIKRGQIRTRGGIQKSQN